MVGTEYRDEWKISFERKKSKTESMKHDRTTGAVSYWHFLLPLFFSMLKVEEMI